MKILEDHNIRDASERHVSRYTKLVNCGEGVVVYRGLNVPAAIELYRVSCLQNNAIVDDLIKKIYMIGTKANYYVGNRQFSASEAFLARSEDASDQFMRKLFLRLQHVLVRNRLGKKVISAYRRECPNFIKSIERLNVENLIKELRECSELDRLFIRDYYLGFLHQIYDRNRHKTSPLLSSTTCKQTALSFGGEEGIVFEYFIPKYIKNMLCIPPYHAIDDRMSQILVRYDLPIFPVPPYPLQQEYSIKRALLPHFITSVTIPYNHDRQDIVLHPGFSAHNYNHNRVLRDGLPLDQTNFEAIARQTQFYRFGYFDGRRFNE